MNVRRWLLALMVAAALPAKVRAQENALLSLEGPYEPTIQCPPTDDGYKWERTRKPSLLVLWAIPRDDWSVIGPYLAVHYTLGNVSIIYARTTLTGTPDALFRHETCHAAGWVHQETRGIGPAAGIHYPRPIK